MQTTPGTSLSDEKPPAVATPPHKSRLALWVSIALVTVVLDQATKAWAERALADGQPRELVGDILQLRLTHNPGAAFSIGTGYTIVLTVVALAVIAVCIKLASRLGSVWWEIALGLLLGGAIGNVTDRIFRDPAPFRGHVVDFLELPHWPVFNIADAAICVAAGMFVVLSLLGHRFDGTHDRS